MAELVRCRACGYVTDERRLGEICPACGVSAGMFDPYSDPVSEKRRKILSAHIHPFMVHFAQAFAVTLFPLTLSAFILKGELLDYSLATSKTLAVTLPFFLLLSIISGVFDGNIRFSKFSRSPILKSKLLWGSVFLALSVAYMFLILAYGFSTLAAIAGLTAISAGFAGCAVVLGMLGSGILNAQFPG